MKKKKRGKKKRAQGPVISYVPEEAIKKRGEKGD